MGMRPRSAPFAEAEVSDQAGDGRGVAGLLGPVPAPRLWHHIPEALQSGTRLAGLPLLNAAALAPVQPPISL